MSFPIRSLIIILTTNLIIFQTISAQHDQYDHVNDDVDILKAEMAYKNIYSSPSFDEQIEERVGIGSAIFKSNNYGILRKFIYTEIIQNGNNYAAADVIVDAVFESLYMHKDQLNLAKTIVTDNSFMPSNKEVNGPCVNMDFETGDASGWELFEGLVTSQVAGSGAYHPAEAPGSQHNITSAGIDMITGLSTVNPTGGLYSMKLGDDSATGGLAASIQQTFLVSEENSAFTYSYAIVLEDPSDHLPGEKPFFRVSVIGENGDVETCGDYVVIAQPSLGSQNWISFSNSFGNGWYKDWETVFVPLDQYLGQNVTIQVTVGDCDQNGHFGYAYFDAECSSQNLIPPATLICDNVPITLNAPLGAINYQWNTGETSSSISTSQEGDYSVVLTPTQGADCNITLHANLIGAPSSPHAAFEASKTSLCIGEELQLTDSSYTDGPAEIDSWNWNLGDDTPQLGEQNLTHIYDSVGNYEVELAVELFFEGLGTCSDTTWKSITVHNLPTPAFTNSTECFGVGTSFTDMSHTSDGIIDRWEWDFNSADNIDSEEQNPTYTFLNSGVHSVSLTAITSFDCRASISRPVKVYDNPIASFETIQNKATMLSPIYDFANTSEFNENNLWVFDNLGLSTELEPSFVFPDDDEGIYEVCLEVESENGCVDHSCKNVYIEGVATFYIPNSFSPNEDGINDLFAPVTNGLDPKAYSFNIYNRWGKNVFNSSNIGEIWNGVIGNNYAPIGMYTYTLQSKNRYTNEVFVKSGTVTIIR